MTTILTGVGVFAVGLVLFLLMMRSHGRYETLQDRYDYAQKRYEQVKSDPISPRWKKRKARNDVRFRKLDLRFRVLKPGIRRTFYVVALAGMFSGIWIILAAVR